MGVGGGNFCHICFWLHQLRMQDAVLSTAVVCCDSTQWTRHTHIHVHGGLRKQLCSQNIHRHTNAHTHTHLSHASSGEKHNGCKRTHTTAKSANGRGRMTRITCREEGEEGAALPPAAGRLGLQHPHPCITTPRPKKNIKKTHLTTKR